MTLQHAEVLPYIDILPSDRGVDGGGQAEYTKCELCDNAYDSQRGDVRLNKDVSLAENFCGVATVGDRGQIVIPSEARKKIDISPGDKMAVIRHPGTDGLIICKIKSLREFLDFLAEEMDQIESKMNQAQDPASDE